MAERFPIDAPPEAVVVALGDILRERSVTEYAVVDHGHYMARRRATRPTGDGR